MIRRMALLLACSIVVVGCGNQPATQTAPTRAATNATEGAVVTSTSSAPVASVPQATPITTASPAASPFPLEAGWWDSAVCYEVLVRSFYDSNGDGVGDLNGLIQKLDYINDGSAEQQKDLGAPCIWLMPIAESPSHHGYDVVDYYTVDREYGTNDDFKRLVTEAHKRGIRIILDLVLNHTSSEHPWFKEAADNPQSPYRDWYLWSTDDPGYKGPWGQQVWHTSPGHDEYYYGIFWSGMPDLNYRNPAVTQEAEKISAFWLNEMGADGFRLDAIKHLIESGTVQENTPETHAWLRHYRSFLEQTKPDAFTIGEIFGGSPVTLKPYYPDQLDTYFAFDVGNALITAAATGQARQFAGAVRVADRSLPFQRWAPFLTNHDQDRVMSALGDDVAKAKIAAIALLTLPGLPFLYYGEEIGMLGVRGPEGPDADAPRRSPMQWSGEAGAGFTTGQPWQALQGNYQAANVAAQEDDPDSLLNLYRRLVHLHTSEQALAQGSFTILDTGNNRVAAFLRQSGDDAVLVAINFGREDVSNLTITADESELAPGSYQLQPLLGDTPGAALQVADGGAIAEYVPLATLEAQMGSIFKLIKQ
jgi:glycosidase